MKFYFWKTTQFKWNVSFTELLIFTISKDILWKRSVALNTGIRLSSCETNDAFLNCHWVSHCSNPLLSLIFPVSHPQTEGETMAAAVTTVYLRFCVHMNCLWAFRKMWLPQINYWSQYIPCSSERNKLFSLNSPVYQKKKKRILSESFPKRL